MAGVLDQQFVTNDLTLGVSDNASRGYVAQGVTAGLAGAVLQVDLYLKIGAGNLAGKNLSVEIWSNNAGKPSAKLSDTTSYDLSSVTSSLVFYSVPISGSGLFNVSDNFHIVCYSNLDGSNYVAWGRNSSGGYGGGYLNLSSDASTWNSTTGQDMNFKTYMGTEGGGAFKNILPYYTQ